MSAAPTVEVEPIFVADGDNFLVNTAIAGAQRPASAAPLPGGGFVATWLTNPTNGDSNSERVVAQIFGSDGTALGAEFAVAPDLDRRQSSPSVVTLEGGGFAIGWFLHEEGVDRRVLVQRYDSSGQPVGDEITIATLGTTATIPGNVDLTALPGGGFLTTWTSFEAQETSEAMARLYDADGAPLGAAFQVNTYTTDTQSITDSAVLADGSLVFIWNSFGQDGQFDGVYAQRFNAAGVPIGSEFRINTVTTGIQGGGEVAALAGGGFVVTWSEPNMFGPSLAKARIYDAAGVAVGGEITVTSFNSPGAGPVPVVAVLPDGDFVIAWYKFFGEIQAQRYEADGTPRGVAFDISTSTPGQFYLRSTGSIIATDSGELIVFWHSGQNPNPNDSDIFAQRYQIQNQATEQVALVLTNAITVGDDGQGSNVVTATLSVDFGLLTVATEGSGVVADGNGTASVELTGTVDQLNALLIGGAGGKLSYLANSDTPPSDATLTIEVRDIEDQVASTAVPLALLAVNDAPTVTITLPISAPVGGETRVNTFIPNNQTDAAVAALPGGGYVVTWMSQQQDDNYSSRPFGIYAQRYDAAGAPLGAETRVNSTVMLGQMEPAVASSSSGYVIMWRSEQSGGDDIYMQRYDLAGVPQGGETRVNSDATNDIDADPSIAALSGGDYVVVWGHDQPGFDSTDVVMRRYSAAGVALGAEVRVNTYTTNGQFMPEVAALADGGYVVVWISSYQNFVPWAVYSQRYDAAGVAQGGETRVDGLTPGEVSWTTVAGLEGGGYVVVWSGDAADDDLYGIFMQRYDAAGVALGVATQVNTYTEDYQVDPAVAALSGGGYVITWNSNGQDGDSVGVYSQRFDASGNAVGGETLVNTVTAAAQGAASVAGLAADSFVVAWQSPYVTDHDIYTQRYGDGFFATEQVALSLKGTTAIADVDYAGETLSVTLSVDFGILNVTAGDSGASVDAGNGTDNVIVSGTLAQLNALLGSGGTSTLVFTANGDDPPAGATLTVEVQDADDQVASTTAAITIIPVDDPGVALPDAATTTEAATKSGNIFADNGSGADHDPDDPDDPLTVVAVNGSAVAVGATIALPSGALLTVQANGNYLYNPNGQFNALPAAGSGASNLTAQDSFTYTLAGGSTATMTLTITGLDTDDTLLGTAGNDSLSGGAGNDTLNGGAGADSMTGGIGDDTYHVDNAGDVVTELAGQGSDTVQTSLAVLTLAANVENLAYNGAAGATLTGNGLNNVITGNSGNDTLRGSGGLNTLNGGDGDDTLVIDVAPVFVFPPSGPPTMGTYHGGTGFDTLLLADVVPNDVGQTRGGIGFLLSLATISGVERLVFGSTAAVSQFVSVRLSDATSGLTQIVGGDGIDGLLTVIDASAATSFTMPNYALTNWNASATPYLAPGDTLVLSNGSGHDAALNSREGLAATQMLIGGFFNETLNGASGVDILEGRGGLDVLNGNDGNDMLVIANFRDYSFNFTNFTGAGSSYNGGNGEDVLSIGGAVTFAGTVSGIESLYLQPAYDPGTASDIWEQLPTHLTIGAQTMAALPSNLLLRGTGAITVDLAPGDSYDASDFVLASGASIAHVVNGSTAGDTIEGLQVADTLNGNDGDDQIAGGGGNDSLTGGEGSDTLDGGEGNDALGGGGDADWLQGGEGDDGESGGTGHDSVWGGAGGDYLDGGEGDDTISGNEGSDTVTYAFAGLGVEVDLSWLEEQDTRGAGWDTLVSIENLVGSAFDDRLSGDGAANHLRGGAGADVLTGGGGNDAFHFGDLDSTPAAPDLIADFAPGDVIVLYWIDADTGTGGDQAFHLGATAGHTGDVVLAFDAANDRTSLSLYVNGDAIADGLIWLSGNHTALTGADFIL